MNNKKTFHEVSEIWCDAKRPIVKHSTLCAYQLTLQTHLLPRFGAAENITEKDVQQFVIDKCTSGLARKTVRDIVAVLKSVIKYGNKHGIFHFEEWEIEYPTQTENKLPPTLSLNHQRILMRHLLEQPTPQNIGVLLALCTGMRIGEVCALKWEDVDFERGIAWLDDVKHPRMKTGNRRAFRLLSDAAQIVQAMPRGGDGRVFPYQSKSVGSAFTRACRLLGIEGLHFHDLRHEATSRLFERGYSIQEVSQFTLHDSWATLKRYTHLRPEQVPER